MRRQKTDAQLLCYASIIVLSLNACTQHGSKLKNGAHLTDNSQPASTANDKKTRATSHSGKNSGRWLRKKDKSLASAGASSTKSSSQYDNLWDRLFDLYDLPPIEHEDVDRELAWFINHPDYIDRVQRRAEPFLYSIVKQVEKHDIPGEIALLPVIESAFQPHAVSPANAAGIWQFIPSTGRLYGLKQSHSYDGRRDIYASTRAAIKYLKKLHSDFNGDWLLAIAAYNCGEGAVGRAIQKNMARGLPTDFWSLELPQETRSYVPRLLAVARLFIEADQHGVDLHAIPNQAVFKPVKVDTQIDLALAADAADISLEKLYELNPGFKRQFTDVDGSYRLFIPATKKTAEFKEELVKLAQEARFSGGDRPITEEISADAGTSSVASNNLVVSADSAGTLVSESKPRSERDFSSAPFQKERRESVRDKVPVQEPVRERAAQFRGREEPAGKLSSRVVEKARDRSYSTALASAEEKGHNRLTKKASYTVQPGETLWSVARKHSVDVEQLAKWNNFSEKTGVKAGQTLVVWDKNAAKKLTLVNAGIRPSQSIRYTVREGDTLFSISRRFKVSVADLRKWNGANVEKQIQPGKNITVQRDKD
jgi:membrane-bound lytic murein transglycosylase D